MWWPFRVKKREPTICANCRWYYINRGKDLITKNVTYASGRKAIVQYGCEVLPNLGGVRTNFETGKLYLERKQYECSRNQGRCPDFRPKWSDPPPKKKGGDNGLLEARRLIREALEGTESEDRL